MTANDTTSVHPEETTALPNLPDNYQQYRRRQCEPEWLRTEWLYSHIDSIEGTGRAEKLAECRLLAWFARNRHTGEVRVMSSACKLRWCPICSQSRTLFLTENVTGWLHDVAKPKMATFTMKHTSAPLDHQIKWLYKHFRAFRNRKKIRGYIRGGVWFFQLKRAKLTGEWHPHLHCCLDSDYIPQDILSAEWKAQTKSSSIVDIRAIHKPDKVAEYVARYCARPAQLADFSDDDVIEIFTVFHGRRLCGSWGSGKQCGLTAKPTSDRSDWTSCGSWGAVVSQMHSLPRAAAVIQAWRNGTPLAEGIHVPNVATAEQKFLGREPPSLGIEDIRFKWWEFDT